MREFVCHSQGPFVRGVVRGGGGEGGDYVKGENTPSEAQ